MKPRTKEQSGGLATEYFQMVAEWQGGGIKEGIHKMISVPTAAIVSIVVGTTQILEKTFRAGFEWAMKPPEKKKVHSRSCRPS